MSMSTLVLLLIAIALLAVAYIQPFQPFPGRIEKMAAATVQIESRFFEALDRFKTAVGRYPTTAEGLHVLITREDSLLAKIPRDPWGNEYQYTCPGVHNVDSYDLYSFGPDGQRGTADDIGNWQEPASRP